MSTHLIVGGGAAGLEAAITIRKLDPQSEVTLVTEEPWLPYYRPKLVHFLAESQGPDSLLTHELAWYASSGIRVLTDTRISAIDPATRTARDQRGQVHAWDRLLLATGSQPFVPPLPGAGRQGVFTLRSIEDSLKIKAAAASAARILVVGGGLLGLESAWAFRQRGLPVSVVETAPWLLPRQLDAEGGAHLQRLLEDQGLEFRLGDQAAGIEGEGDTGPVRCVGLKSGACIDAGLVLFSIGIRLDTAWLAGSGIEAKRGIVVDARMATSAPGVWAAGDVCEFQGTCQGLWMSAREQGRVAGTNMAGGEAIYQPAPPSSQLKITGIDVFSAGDPAAAGARVITSHDSGGYRKLVLNGDGTVAAVMVIGDKSAIQNARKILAGSLPADGFLPR